MAADVAITEALTGYLTPAEFEIIFVDDGSRDDTFTHLSELASKRKHVRVLKLACNVGTHAAIRAGFDKARGHYACFIACDLQDPPEVLTRMLDACVDPIELVWGIRESRKDAFVPRLGAWLFYALARHFVSKELPSSGSSVFLLGPTALEIIRGSREKNITLEGIFANARLNSTEVPYHRSSRETGSSKWTLAKRARHFVDFFVYHSRLFPRILWSLGIVLIALSASSWVIIPVLEWGLQLTIMTGAWMLSLVLTFQGLQFMLLAAVTEYLCRILDEVRVRPLYLIETELGPEFPGSNVSPSTEPSGSLN